jgi:hypothetical protein
MFSKLLELTGLGLIAWGLAWAIAIPAGLIFGGAAIVLVGSVTDDQSVGMALRRGAAWVRYGWWKALARENGVPIPSFKDAVVRCECGGDPDCPVCGGSGAIPDPTLQVGKGSPHPPIHVDPQTEAFWATKAKARTERSKVGDRTRALSRPDYQYDDDLERIG